MRDNWQATMGLIFGTVLFLFIVGDFVGDRIESRYLNMQQQAIERGYALYCPRSGEFAWVGECEQKGEE